MLSRSLGEVKPQKPSKTDRRDPSSLRFASRSPSPKTSFDWKEPKKAPAFPLDGSREVRRGPTRVGPRSCLDFKGLRDLYLVRAAPA
jgi:hypothetical protein